MSDTAPMPGGGSRRRLVLLGLSALVVLLDQITKVWAVRALAGGPIAVIDRILYLDLATNTGAAFSLFERHPEILTIVASLVAIGVAIWLFRTDLSERLTPLALSLILGGAVGNLIDRYTVGHVIDFVRVHFAIIDWSWPTFNVADSAICFGMGLLIWATFLAQPVGEPALTASPDPKGQDSHA